MMSVYPLRSPIKTHELKIAPEYFRDIAANDKRFEIRKDDRDFKVGENLLLRCWTENEGFHGPMAMMGIEHIARGCPGLVDGYCIMSTYLKFISEPPGWELTND